VTVADGWDDGAHALVTLTGLGVGTVALDDPVVGVDRAYVSPEQRAGGEPDERSDVFGLAALLHHALFGAPPADVDTTAAAGCGWTRWSTCRPPWCWPPPARPTRAAVRRA
jgi:hypothetical protein